ncbi:TPA: hypothetical protein HA318_01285 [Candidatus Micrarchaeota archaeon]|nr:hypothetical protein [Candidatus Micrarchaeota archaeon]
MVAALLIAGCTQKAEEYKCPNGSIADEASKCVVTVAPTVIPTVTLAASEEPPLPNEDDEIPPLPPMN